jgi:RNA polymerase sigma-70 factor (ECF subfamily)
MPGEPDGDVLRRFAGGDEHAFEQLFRHFEAAVYSWILRIVRDRSGAEDVLVEAFWRAYRGRGTFDPRRSFGAWMRRIATNAALDYLRTARNERVSRPADDTLPAPRGRDADTNQAIAIAFRRLPPDLQIVAALALLEEQPYADIADALGIPEGTVKSRVFRATRMLREELARLGVRPWRESR